MAQRTVTIASSVGLHARPAATFVKAVAEKGVPIYVHAKIVIVDDRLIRVGSSNLNNRSLGFDSECDVAIEADPNDPADGDLRETILSMRTRLLSEHLGVDHEVFDDALAQENSLVGAVDRLTGPGRTLEAFDHETIDGEESLIAENELVDPEDARIGTIDRIYRAVIRRGTRNLLRR